MKNTFDLKDEQTRPYTFNIQPFIADKNVAQQGYLTSEPYSIQKAGVKANVFLLSDLGYPAYSTTITCLDKTLTVRKSAVAAFVKASIEGWKSYLDNPTPGNTLIQKENPDMTSAQLGYSLTKLKEKGIVTSGDAGKLGIASAGRARKVSIKVFFWFKRAATRGNRFRSSGIYRRAVESRIS